MNPIFGCTDTHAHIASLEYNADRADVLARAWEAGLSAIVVIGAGDGIQGNRRAAELVATDVRLFAAFGVHPQDVGSAQDEWESEIEYLCCMHPKKAVAIGEIGLDYHYPDYPRDAQHMWLRRQLALARKLHLPIIIHDRDAHDDMLAALDEGEKLSRGGVFHCFSGDVHAARGVIARGFHISIPGIVTFKKAEKLQQIAREIPLEHVLIETDAPYLAPVPHRGKRNEPAFVVEVARAIASLRGITPDEVARVTTENARRLFNIF